MPITNGDAQMSSVQLTSPGEKVLDYTKALDVLKETKEYAAGDGLDVYQLLDSDKHGALTYNDFLVLPGYIGKRAIHSISIESR